MTYTSTFGTGAEIDAALVKADTAVQPGALGTAAAAATGDFATAAQGTLAASAVQPGDAATDLNGTAHRLFYTNGTGDVTELAFGADGTVLTSTGTTTAPAFEAVSGTGTVTSVGLASTTGLTFTGGPITSSGNITIAVTYGTGANTICQGNDARLSDSREWTGATVAQAEAEAGTATDRRAWTAQRVAQAIDAQTGGTLADWRDIGSETLIAATSGLQAAKIAYADLFVLARDFETNENDARIVDTFGGGTYTPRADQTVLWRGYSIKPVNMAEDDIWLGAPEFIVVAVSDETTALTTGTAKRTFRMPGAFTLVDVRASVTTAPTGSVLTVDINEAGTTVLSTKLTIDAAANTSVGAAAPPVISDSAIAADAEITIDIDTVGSSVAGAGLKVTLIGYFV